MPEFNQESDLQVTALPKISVPKFYFSLFPLGTYLSVSESSYPISSFGIRGSWFLWKLLHRWWRISDIFVWVGLSFSAFSGISCEVVCSRILGMRFLRGLEYIFAGGQQKIQASLHNPKKIKHNKWIIYIFIHFLEFISCFLHKLYITLLFFLFPNHCPRCKWTSKNLGDSLSR